MMEHGYIIHFDNETELVHFGVRGMKWKKGKKSAKKPLLTTDYRRRENKLLNNRAKKVENQLTKDLNSDKKIDKHYKIGSKGGITLIQDKEGSSTFSYGHTPKYDRIANKIVNKAYERHINHVENKKPINRGKKTIKNIFKKLFG